MCTEPISFNVTDKNQMISFASAFAKCLKVGDVVCFDGDLGAGKTFFTQQVLNTLGYQGVVTSPTFSIVESYPLQLLTNEKTRQVVCFNHFDLYRIEELQELENIGFRDYFNLQSINFIEWAANAKSLLPKNVHTIEIQFNNNHRQLLLNSNYSVSI